MGPIRTRSPDTTVRSLGLLFGTMYFVQGIAEPTEGLIAQPVRSLLKTWGHSAGDIATFSAVLALPWILKPLYGLITDFLPLCGSRRKSYLVLATASSASGLALLYLAPPPVGSWNGLLAMLLIPAVGVAFADVVVDALMVEHGQPRGITGQLQSIQWGAIYAATILTGVAGGWLSAHGRQDLGWLVCAGFAALGCAMTLKFVREPPAREELSGRAALALLVGAVRSRTIFGVALFLFLLNFNPFASAILYVHMTRELALGEQFYGLTVSLGAVSAIVASISYGFYCRRVRFERLVHVAIALAAGSALAYCALEGRASAVALALVVGFANMTATLIQLDLAARLCPPRIAGTVFALLMAVANLGYSTATALGGQLYDHWLEAWGAPTAFRALVVVGAAATALCWLVLPLLRSSMPVDPSARAS